MLAVIDLGSNTFHLLIGRINRDHSIEEIYRERVFVGLSDGGVERIKSEKIALGLTVCRRFFDIVREHQVKSLKVVGTAVLRRAINRADFLNPCAQIFSQPVEIIDGQREAELIFKGVRLMPFGLRSSVVMDIGGGSVEFIIVENDEAVYAESIEIGVGILHSLFHHSEPISSEAVQALKAYIKEAMKGLANKKPKEEFPDLIGASGSFEIIKALVPESDDLMDNEVDLQAFDAWANRIIGMTMEERAQIDGMPVERVKLIVVALLLIKESIAFFKPKRLLFSPYALKEGLFYEASQTD